MYIHTYIYIYIHIYVYVYIIAITQGFIGWTQASDNFMIQCLSILETKTYVALLNMSLLQI